MFITTFKRCLPYILKSGVAPMVIGHHGIGKSQAVKQFCEENDYRFIDLRLGTQDVGDLLGLADFERDGNGNLVATRFFQPNWFPREGEKAIVFLDEINRARRDVLQSVFQLILDKRLHTYELPEGCHVVGAMNPNTEDYFVTDISDKAFLDRFLFIKLTPSKNEWFNYAKNKQFEPELLQFLKEQPEMLENKLEDFSLRDIVKPSRRSWEFVDNVFKLQKQNMPINLLRELTIGLVGYEAGSAFITSLKEQDKPLTGEDILKRFPKVKSKLKKFSNHKTGGRIDLIKYTCDNIAEIIQERSSKNQPLKKEEEQNLADFLMVIPKDLTFDLCRTIYLEAIARPVLDNHKKLKEMLRETRGINIESMDD